MIFQGVPFLLLFRFRPFSGPPSPSPPRWDRFLSLSLFHLILSQNPSFPLRKAADADLLEGEGYS